MTTQPEIPDELRQEARQLIADLEAYATDWVTTVARRNDEELIAAILLAERTRTIEECAGIAIATAISVERVGGIGFGSCARGIADDIRALLK